jgi:hypothetical protein
MSDSKNRKNNDNKETWVISHPSCSIHDCPIHENADQQFKDEVSYV